MLILGGAWPFSRLRTQKVSWPEGSWLDKINGRTKPGPPDRLACAWCRAEGTSLVRGTYYDQWQPERQPNEARSFDGFLKEVARGLASIRPVNSPDATQLSSTYFHSTSIAVRWNRSANRCAKTCGGYGRRAPWVMPPAERHPVVGNTNRPIGGAPNPRSYALESVCSGQPAKIARSDRLAIDSRAKEQVA